MEYQDAKNGDFFVLSLKGRLDAASAPDFDKKASETIETENSIIVDCAGLEYVNSSGLRTFLSALKKAGASGKKFYLCSMRQNIKEIFEISGFANIFMIFDDVDEALKN